MGTKAKDTDITWVKFGDVNSLSFVGKEVVLLGYENYIMFVDVVRPEKKEVVYRATNDLKGDGIECLCTHRSLPCFAIAEKCRNPRILIISYPSLENLKNIEPIQETSYVALRFSEMEYLIALTGLPNYMIVVWNWRTSEKICCQETDLRSTSQILRVSLTSPIFIAQTDQSERKLIMWEMNMCYKKAMLNHNSIVLPKKSRPPYAYAWGFDGELYFSDSEGNLYSANPENRTCQLALPWNGDEGTCHACLTWYKGGWVYAGPNKIQCVRRKSPEGWTRSWSFTPAVPVKAVASSSFKELLICWNEMHELQQLKAETANVDCVTIRSYGSNFDFVCFLYPLGDHFVTYGNVSKCFRIWKQATGVLVSSLEWTSHGVVRDVKSNPMYPYVLVAMSTGKVAAINLFDETYPAIMHEAYLTKDPLDAIRFHASGNKFCVANMEIGAFFLIKIHGEPKMEVLATIRLDLKIVNFALIGDVALPELVVLPMSQLCCRSGQTFLLYNVIPQKKIFRHMQDVPVYSLMTSFCPKEGRELFCVPHRSRSLYMFDLGNRAVTKQFVSGHQMKSYSINYDGNFLITFGYDGFAIVRHGATMQCVTLMMPHHRMSKGIKDAILDPYCTSILTLGVDGTIVCHSYNGQWCKPGLRTEFVQAFKTPLYKQMLAVPLAVAKARARAIQKLASEAGSQKSDHSDEEEHAEKEIPVERTWLEIRELEKFELDQKHCIKERALIVDQLAELQEKIVELLDENAESSPQERLPIHFYDMDKAHRRKRLEDARAEREKEKYMQLATIKARDKVSEYIKKSFWDSINVKGRELRGIMSPIIVESYPLKSTQDSSKEESFWMLQRIKLEEYYRKGDYFEPWVPRSDSMLELHLNTKSHISDVDVALTVKTKFEEDQFEEQNEEVEKSEKDNPLLWSGTTTHNFIDVTPHHYSQFELAGFHHGYIETQLIAEDVMNLMIWFNKKFNEAFAIKEREVATVIERNNRLRHIVKELQFFNFSPDICRTVILNPEWSPNEQPERIMVVEDNELTVLPYITASEEELRRKQEAENERIRQLMLADDFKEKALITMMDGVLEKLWENEIKKEVPKPKVMLEKEPENYTEDDLKAIRTYEEAVRFLRSERERYHKILQNDWAKIVNSIRDSVTRFDDKLAKLHLLKMQVDAAIGQEYLKILRIKTKLYQKKEFERKEESMKEEITNQERKIEIIQTELPKLTETLNDCKNYYEALQNRDRNMDKNFKREFPDYSPVLCEQLYKLSKKRPKLLQRAALFSTLLIDLGKCAVSGTKPDYLTTDCIQYLKDIDALDNNVNAPAAVSDHGWELMCKLRRAKIECELKVRACAVDLGEAEATVASYNKKLKQAKDTLAQLQNELYNHREEKMLMEQNYTIQLVLKSGLVEVPLSGSIRDFDESVLVTRDTLLDINGIITKAGNQKIKAMQKAANFRKGIIFKEWEHKKLRMEIEDLKNSLNTVQSIKVTKELQSILIGRARGFTDEKGFLYLEEELLGVKEKFENAQTDLFLKIDICNQKIENLNIKNDEIDLKIAEVNAEVNELGLEIDKDFDAKHIAENLKRMKRIRYSSKLLQKIQEHHNEIHMLQTELELLRLRTFPTLKNKS